MRPAQKPNRSRGRGNRKSGGGGNGGNNINRVFDSAGPEGKVRGTPQQIIDKYLSLARDSQTSGDRVGAENFLQHAEHYQRILILANATQEQARREAQEAATDQQPNRGGESMQHQNPAAAPQHSQQPQPQQAQPQPQPQQQAQPQPHPQAQVRPQPQPKPQVQPSEQQQPASQPAPVAPQPSMAAAPIGGMTTIDSGIDSGDAQSSLIVDGEELAPSKPKPKAKANGEPRPRRPRKPKVVEAAVAEAPATEAAPAEQSAEPAPTPSEG